jgi:hypothetical protein
MEIELYSILAMVILVSTVATVVFATFSYLAFRLKRRQKPSNSSPGAVHVAGPQFFKRCEPVE